MTGKPGYPQEGDTYVEIDGIKSVAEWVRENGSWRKKEDGERIFPLGMDVPVFGALRPKSEEDNPVWDNPVCTCEACRLKVELDSMRMALENETRIADAARKKQTELEQSIVYERNEIPNEINLLRAAKIKNEESLAAALDVIGGVILNLKAAGAEKVDPTNIGKSIKEIAAERDALTKQLAEANSDSANEISAMELKCGQYRATIESLQDRKSVV